MEQPFLNNFCNSVQKLLPEVPESISEAGGGGGGVILCHEYPTLCNFDNIFVQLGQALDHR